MFEIEFMEIYIIESFYCSMIIFQRRLKGAAGVMTLLGTGWFFGIFMSIPAPDFQVGMQYLFILLNSTQVSDFVEIFPEILFYSFRSKLKYRARSHESLSIS